MEHLMSFFGDSKANRLCSHELEDGLKRELEEQKYIIEEYDE